MPFKKKKFVGHWIKSLFEKITLRFEVQFFPYYCHCVVRNLTMFYTGCEQKVPATYTRNYVVLIYATCLTEY